jgi:predicted nicotinamide N-methyase
MDTIVNTKDQQQQQHTTTNDVEEDDVQVVKPFLFVHDIPIYFQEDWRTGIGGGLWSTGLAMGEYFGTESALSNLYHLSQRCSSRYTEQPSSSTTQLSILELGSGNGFLAVCLVAAIASLRDKLQIRDFVITDDMDHLDMIQQTIKNNPHTSPYSENITIMEHRWGIFTNDNTKVSTTETNTNSKFILDGSKKFDLIIGSDVAYRDYLYDPLIRSLNQFSHSETISLIGVTMTDTKPEFFHQLDRAKFMYKKLADHLMHPQFRGTTFGIFAIQRKT